MPNHSGQRRILTRRKKKARYVQPMVVVCLPNTCKKWTKEQMASAMEAVRSGSRINCAALDHGVPCTVLEDRFSGRVKDGTPQPY